MKLHNGWFYPASDDFMWKEAAADGSYQADHLMAALRFVTDYSLAVDGGSHIGSWAWLMSSRFERVIAVEPAADTFECLQANISQLELHNVEARNVALGATSGRVSMALDAKQAQRKNTGGRFVIEGGRIKREPMDKWNLPSLGFLKLDVEGSEVDCLKGATETLRRCRPVVLWEDKGFCRKYGYGADAPRALLEGIGYEHRVRVGHDEIWAAA